MDRAGRQSSLQRLMVNAAAFGLLLGLAFLVVVFIGEVNGNEKAVEEGNHPGVGERTRSECVGAASAAAHGHMPVVCEEEDGPVVFLCEALGVADVLSPADLIEASIFHGRLPIQDAVFTDPPYRGQGAVYTRPALGPPRPRSRGRRPPGPQQPALQ